MKLSILAVLALGACQQSAAKLMTAAANDGPTISVQALASELGKPAAERPVILHVGFHNLFEEGHIPGALDMGPGATPEGLAALEAELRSLPKGRPVVLYCGCCPWDHCPNIRPALALATRLGRAVTALAIPHSFRNDWKKLGLPVATGAAGAPPAP
ncbi:MAG: rhodanese-like domain-containing protein [Deltaproteobacteria bacterium]